MRYSAEFKACAVARILEEEEKPTVVSRDLGVSVGQLKTWRLEQQVAGSAEALARQKAEDTELRRMVKENRNCYGPLRVFHKPIQGVFKNNSLQSVVCNFTD
jgi:transposase